MFKLLYNHINKKIMEIKKEELKNAICDVTSKDSTVGLHGIKRSKTGKSKENIKTNMERVFSIFDSGLNVITRHSGVHGTVLFEGSPFDKEFEDSLMKYRWSDSINYIVVSIPEKIKSIDGKELYLGRPSLETYHERELDVCCNDPTTCMAEAIFGTESAGLYKIPSFFILGNYRLLDNEMVNFTYNPNFIGFRKNLVSEEEYDVLKSAYDKYCKKMDKDDFAFNNTKKQEKKYNDKLGELGEITNRTKEILANPDTVEQAVSDMKFNFRRIFKMKTELLNVINSLKKISEDGLREGIGYTDCANAETIENTKESEVCKDEQ